MKVHRPTQTKLSLNAHVKEKIELTVLSPKEYGNFCDLVITRSGTNKLTIEFVAVHRLTVSKDYSLLCAIISAGVLLAEPQN